MPAAPHSSPQRQPQQGLHRSTAPTGPIPAAESRAAAQLFGGQRWPLGLFFASGAAALVYQVVWSRLLGRVVGSDALGNALTLTAFMLGLGLGAPLFARRAMASAQPARWWAALVGGTALWAAGSALWLTEFSPQGSPWMRGALATALLLPPTLLMGGTVPAMTRWALSDGRGSGAGMALCYAVNTAGAALGALLGTFLLLPRLGLSQSLWAAAGLEAGAALLALAFSRAAARDASAQGQPVAPPSAQHGELSKQASPARSQGNRPRVPLLWAAALLGAAGLTLEVLATRTLSSLMGSSAYAFAIVLAVFLGGLALGSEWARRALERQPASRSLEAVVAALPLMALAGLGLLAWRTGGAQLFEGAVNLAPAGGGLLRLWLASALLAALCLLPPALCLGAALPLLVGRAELPAGAGSSGPAPRPEGGIAWLYASNSLGAALGALLTGSWLIPALGLERAWASLWLPAALAWLCVRSRGPRADGPRAPQRLAALFLLLGLLLAGGLWWQAARPRQTELLYARAGSLSNAVVDAPPGAGGVRSLRINGKVVASTEVIDLRLQRLLGAIPLWLHGQVQSAYVIGLGTGMTAGALLLEPKLQELEVVEISRAVAGAAQHFAPWNQNLLDAPQLTLRIADGRHALATETRRFDLITSDPIHPWTRGSSDLYALEHFEAMAAHLAPGGVASQWLPLYQLSLEDVQTVCATWCAAFPQTAAYLTAYDLALLGSRDRPVTPGAEPAPLWPELNAALVPLGIHSACALSALCVADDAALRSFCAGVPPMRSDRPVLEFRAPLSFLGGYSRAALTWAGRPEFVAELPACAVAAGTAWRALLSEFLKASQADWQSAAGRYGAALLELR